MTPHLNRLHLNTTYYLTDLTDRNVDNVRMRNYTTHGVELDVDEKCKKMQKERQRKRDLVRENERD